MIIKQLTLATLDTGTLDFGFVGENEHIKYIIKCDSVFDEYPTATASLLIKAPDNTIYPKTVEVEGYNVGWVITVSDTAYPGNGQIQLTFTEDGAVVKTVIANTNVKDSLVGDDPPPDPIADWISTANQILGKVDGMTASAESLPAGDDPSVTVETVDGHYNLEFGIPAGDPGDPTEIIDDNAGVGDTTKVWSANKSATELSELKSAIDQKAPVILRDASGDIVTFADGADGMPLSSCVVQIDPVQSGTGDPAPDNVRPISGWTGATISRASEISAETSTFYNSTITGQGNPQSSTTRIRTGMMHPGKGQFKLSVSGDWYATIRAFSSDTISSTYYVSDESVSSWTYANGAEFTLTTAEYCVIVLSRNSGDSTTVYPTDCEKLVISPKAKTSVYPVSWQTAAGTVYKGYVDWIAQTLTVTFGSKVIDGTINQASGLFQYSSESEYTNLRGLYAVLLTDLPNDVPYNSGTQKCSHFVFRNYTGRKNSLPDQIFFAGSNRNITWASSTYTTLEEFNQYLVDQNTAGTPVTLIYPLAEPVVYNLSDLPTVTVLKESNIWADCGGISLTYPADTQTYVDTLVQTATDPDGNVIQVTGSTPSITGESGKRYVCGTVDSISITPPGTGIIDVVFTSGTTPTVLTAPGVTWPSWFNPNALDASTIYEINVMNGLGGVMAWQT